MKRLFSTYLGSNIRKCICEEKMILIENKIENKLEYKLEHKIENKIEHKLENVNKNINDIINTKLYNFQHINNERLYYEISLLKNNIKTLENNILDLQRLNTKLQEQFLEIKHK
jgi:hypothetical protein